MDSLTNTFIVSNFAPSKTNVIAMKKLSIICLLALLGIFCACNKPKPVAPEIEFEIHDTIEYYYDGENKGRIICTVDCELPVDTVWWHVPGDGWEGEYFLMQEQDGKYIVIP